MLEQTEMNLSVLMDRTSGEKTAAAGVADGLQGWLGSRTSLPKEMEAPAPQKPANHLQKQLENKGQQGNSLQRAAERTAPALAQRQQTTALLTARQRNLRAAALLT